MSSSSPLTVDRSFDRLKDLKSAEEKDRFCGLDEVVNVERMMFASLTCLCSGLFSMQTMLRKLMCSLEHSFSVQYKT